MEGVFSGCSSFFNIIFSPRKDGKSYFLKDNMKALCKTISAYDVVKKKIYYFI